MKKLITILIAILCINVGIGQTIQPRASSNVTVADQNLTAINSFSIPRFQDTTAANASRSLDSSAKLIFTYDVNGVWVRLNNPRKWSLVANQNTLASTISILNDSSISICNSNSCDTFKFTNIVVNNFSVVNDSTILVCDGSNVCDTLSIPPTSIAKTYVDSTVIRGGDSLYYYINGQSYFGGTITATTQSTVSIANDSTLVICNQSGCDTFHFQNIIVNNFSVLNDSTIIVCDGNNTCDTLHIAPIQIAKSYVDSVKVEGSLVYYYINGNKVLAGVLGGKDGLISGGQVIWSGSGLNFIVNSATYIINGKLYNSPLDTVTLDSASIFSRVDLFIVDTTSRAGKITGIADGNLLTPQPDLSYQIALTTGLQINPGDTIPTNVVIDKVYQDNVIPPDWQTGTQGAAMTINFGDASKPFAGTKDIFISKYGNGSTPYFVSPIPYVITTDAVLSFWIYLNGKFTNSMYIELYDNTTYAQTRLNVTPFINRADTGHYQLVTVPLSGFQWSGYYSGHFNTILFILLGVDSTKGFYLDNIQLQKGINSVPSPTDFSLKIDSVTIKKVTLGSDTANVIVNWIKGVPYPKKDTVWTTPSGSTDTTTKVYPLYVIKPILAKNDSTIAFDSLNLTELRYSLGSRDTTKWTDTTLIDKGYLNAKIAAFVTSSYHLPYNGTSTDYLGGDTVFHPLPTSGSSVWSLTGSNAYYNTGNVLIGTNTDDGHTLRVDGTVSFNLGGDLTGDIFYRNSLGSLTPLHPPSGMTKPVLGFSTIPVWQEDSVGSGGATALADTSALFVFGGGGANAGDTASFTTSTIYGSFFNSLSDTLVLTRMQIGLQGTSPNVTVRVYWNDSLNVTAGATALTASGSSATNIYGGTSVTSFSNNKIPPNVWVWCKTSVVTTKPTFLSVTLIGYKKR